MQDRHADKEDEEVEQLSDLDSGDDSSGKRWPGIQADAGLSQGKGQGPTGLRTGN